jgi:hypothetical protein
MKLQPFVNENLSNGSTYFSKVNIRATPSNEGPSNTWKIGDKIADIKPRGMSYRTAAK